MRTTVTYGRRFLIAVFALLVTTLQVELAGAFAATAGVVALQLGGIFFGGSPGSLGWLLFSRVPSEQIVLRTWNSAMHWHIVVTVAAYLTLEKYLSPAFLGLSSALLFFCYGCAKQGCYRLGCCGWLLTNCSFRALRKRIELQKLEALLAFATGAIFLAIALLATNVSQEAVYLSAIGAHLTLREVFSLARASGGMQIL